MFSIIGSEVDLAANTNQKGDYQQISAALVSITCSRLQGVFSPLLLSCLYSVNCMSGDCMLWSKCHQLKCEQF